MGKVLYIEDSAVNAYIIKRIIQSIDLDMLSAYDAAEGLSMAEEHKPSLILTDLVLPDAHGLELIEKLRSDESFVDTPIIALTSTDSPAMKAKCLAAGCNDYLEKPVSKSRMIKTIQKYLGTQV